MFRRRNDALEVLLAHPGGPFFRKKDDGVWTIPKGEIEPGEDLLSRARTEFEEEVGIPANGDWIDLGWVKQKGGKTVYAWAFEGNLPDELSGLLEQFRNGVAAGLEKDAKFSRSRSSLFLPTGRSEAQIEGSANALP